MRPRVIGQGPRSWEKLATSHSPLASNISQPCTDPRMPGHRAPCHPPKPLHAGALAEERGACLFPTPHVMVSLWQLDAGRRGGRTYTTKTGQPYKSVLLFSFLFVCLIVCFSRSAGCSTFTSTPLFLKKQAKESHPPQRSPRGSLGLPEHQLTPGARPGQCWSQARN